MVGWGGVTGCGWLDQVGINPFLHSPKLKLKLKLKLSLATKKSTQTQLLAPVVSDNNTFRKHVLYFTTTKSLMICNSNFQVESTGHKN